MTVAESYPALNHDLFTTTALNVYQYVIFDSLPAKWGTKSVNSVSRFYIRMYSSAGFTTEPIGNSTTPSSVNVYGGFVRNIAVANKIAFIWHRGANVTNQLGKVLYAKVATFPAGAAAAKRNRTALIRLLGD